MASYLQRWAARLVRGRLPPRARIGGQPATARAFINHYEDHKSKPHGSPEFQNFLSFQPGARLVAEWSQQFTERVPGGYQNLVMLSVFGDRGDRPRCRPSGGASGPCRAERVRTPVGLRLGS